jgi:hypothetical protein
MRTFALLAVAAVFTCAAALPGAHADAPAAPARSADEALHALLARNQAFVAAGASCASAASSAPVLADTGAVEILPDAAR